MAESSETRCLHHLAELVSSDDCRLCQGVLKVGTEEMKKSPEYKEQIFALVRPMAEIMARLVVAGLANSPVENICLVGGASRFYPFTAILRKFTGKRVIQVTQPLLVTPPVSH